MRTTLCGALRSIAVVALGAVSALHLLWGCGSAWPASDRTQLADAVGGFTEMPGLVPCWVVAKLLGVAALCVAGVPPSMPRTTRLGSAAAALVLIVRGASGLAGFVPNARDSASFARLDRRVYSPLCLAIGCATAAGAWRD